MWADMLIIFAVSYLVATISGAAGFGGALLLLPVLTGIVGIKAAVPVLTIGQIFGNASRVWFGRNELKWKPILIFLLTAIPLTIIGSYFFSYADKKKIKVGIGIFLILIVVYRRMQPEKMVLGKKGMIIGGGITGFLSGLAGSAGPLGAAFFLGLNLTPTAYIASEAVSALALHLTKTLVYNSFSLVGTKELYYGLFIGIAMIFGSWTGKRIAKKLSKEKFSAFVEILLVILGIHLIWISLSL